MAEVLTFEMMVGAVEGAKELTKAAMDVGLSPDAAMLYAVVGAVAAEVSEPQFREYLPPWAEATARILGHLPAARQQVCEQNLWPWDPETGESIFTIQSKLDSSHMTVDIIADTFGGLPLSFWNDTTRPIQDAIIDWKRNRSPGAGIHLLLVKALAMNISGLSHEVLSAAAEAAALGFSEAEWRARLAWTQRVAEFGLLRFEQLKAEVVRAGLWPWKS